MTGFKDALAVTLRFEGGYVDDPDDRGGATMKGIVQKTYDAWRVKNRQGKVSVKDITDQEVEAIYREEYWIAGQCGALPWPASLCHFDAGVNHGLHNAAKLLQQAVGATPDGKIGPQTLASVNDTPAQKIVSGLLRHREFFYIKIVDRRPSQLKFLRGWIRRVLVLREEVDA